MKLIFPSGQIHLRIPSQTQVKPFCRTHQSLIDSHVCFCDFHIRTRNAIFFKYIFVSLVFGRTLLPLGFFFLKIILLIFGCVGPGCCPGFALVAVSGVYCLVAVLGLLISVASLIAEYGL